MALRKNGLQKPFWTGIDRGRKRCFSGVVDPGVFNEAIILLRLAGYQIIITNSALRAFCWLSITSYPACSCRIILLSTISPILFCFCLQGVVINFLRWLAHKLKMHKSELINVLF